jgi:predicted RNA-binding protein with RPS1 domain
MAPPYHDRGGASDQPPPVGSIERGQVMRIEDYGAFVQLERYHVRGMVHISQLASTRLDKVTDAVSLQDTVWVKVLGVEPGVSQGDRPRYKVSLSMKDASQDGSAEDLGAISEAREQASQALESSLNSTIGMGVARDPMAGYSSGSRLVLKHEKKEALVINGYALVDDTEGELPEPPAPVVNVNVHVAPAAPKAPMGRGRGTTLPSWMTKQDSVEPGPSKGNDRHRSDDDSSERRHRKKKDKSKRKDRKKHSSRKHDDHDRPRESRRSKRRYSDDEEDEEDEKIRRKLDDRHRESRRSKRRYSDDEKDEEDEKSRRKRKSHRRTRSSSEDSAKGRDRSRRKHRAKHSDESESGRDRSRSGRNRDRDQYSDASDDDGIQFENVEEAKKLIEEIDAKRKQSRDERIEAKEQTVKPPTDQER